MKSFFTWLKGLPIFGKIALGIVALAIASSASSPSTQQANLKVQPLATQQAASQKKSTTKEITETQEVDFKKTTENNATLAQGKTQLKQAGVKGTKTVTYKVTYIDNIESDRTIVKDELTTPPIDEITYVGTYVAPAQTSTSQYQYMAPSTPKSSVYYANCTAARAAGAAPIYRGEPGYRPALDRDSDGIACEV